MAWPAWPEECGPCAFLLAAVLFPLKTLPRALPAVVSPTVAIAAAAFPGGVSSGLFEAVWAATAAGIVGSAALARHPGVRGVRRVVVRPGA